MEVRVDTLLLHGVVTLHLQLLIRTILVGVVVLQQLTHSAQIWRASFPSLPSLLPSGGPCSVTAVSLKHLDQMVSRWSAPVKYLLRPLLP